MFSGSTALRALEKNKENKITQNLSNFIINLMQL
jgi:hypothetical protein